MSEACSIQTLRTTWPRMSSPRICSAFACVSAGSSASLTPPALPRPPVSTCALTTTGPPPSSRVARRASAASATSSPSDTGMPNWRKSCFPWYSYRSIRAGADSTQTGRAGHAGTLLAVDAIEAQGLRKRYGKVQALDGVSFGVREGEVFGLLGPNGAGKSTTVRVLTTLTKPDEGTASVAGHDVLREANAVRRAIGYVPQ